MLNYDLHYDTLTGALVQTPEAHPSFQVNAFARLGAASLVQGVSQYPVVVDGVEYPEDLHALFWSDDLGRPTGPMALYVDNEFYQTHIALSGDHVVLAGRASEYDDQLMGFECGATFGDFEDGAYVGQSIRPMTWFTFDRNLRPECGGIEGISASLSFGRSAMTVDGEGGIVLAMSQSGTFVFDEGGPNEVTIVSDDDDPVIVRLTPP